MATQPSPVHPGEVLLEEFFDTTSTSKATASGNVSTAR